MDMDGLDIFGGGSEGVDDILSGIGDNDPTATYVAAIEGVCSRLDSEVSALESTDMGRLGGGQSQAKRIARLEKQIVELRKIADKLRSSNLSQRNAAKNALRNAFKNAGVELTLLASTVTVVNSGAAAGTITQPFNFPNSIFVLGLSWLARALIGTTGFFLTAVSYGASNNILAGFTMGTSVLGAATATARAGVYLGPLDNQPTFMPFRLKVDPSIGFSFTGLNASVTAADSVTINVRAVTITQRLPLLLAQ